MVGGAKYMKKYTYRTKGVCSVEITFESDGEIVKNIIFRGGCNGNTQGVAALADGMRAEELVKRLRGTDCNGRGTSCPDQLAKAIEQNVLSVSD